MVVICVVAVSNLVKVFAMLYVAFGNFDSPLITVGDAIQSFLNRPDPTTSGMCLAGKLTFQPWIRDQSHGPKEWRLNKKRWFGSASKTRWISCLSL